MTALGKTLNAFKGFQIQMTEHSRSLFSQHLPLFPVLVFYVVINISQTLFSLLQNQNGRLTVTAIS